MKHQTRHDWEVKEIADLLELPFINLLHQAIDIHRQNFPENKIQICGVLSIKTGACPEDCAYCVQSGRYKTGIKVNSLLSMMKIANAVKIAKEQGIPRFCMGAAWSRPPEKYFAKILDIVKMVKNLGLESCLTLGTLNHSQVIALKNAGLDCYNHNLDTSSRYYKSIITTRNYEDRIETLKLLCEAGIKICCGGIIGMGETKEDRIDLLRELANFPEHPHSVPINRFVPIVGTPLENVPPIDNFDFVRVVAVARILLPCSVIRLAAGRGSMSDELQALCFCAGANSIFCGDKLLTTKNCAMEKDLNLLQRLDFCTEINKS
jgi:biotin synthase